MRAVHRRGLYYLGSSSFGAYDRTLLLDRAGIDLIVDAGANVGGWAAQLRERGYRGAIISVEPGHDSFARLENRAAEDPLWQVRHAAVGGEDGSIQLNVANDRVSSSLLAFDEEFRHEAAGITVERQESVDLVRLDSLLTGIADGARIWVKLDVEGYELEAIRGAHELLSRALYVDVEMATQAQYRNEPLFFDVAASLYELGFVLVAVQSAVTDPAGRTVRFDGLFSRPTGRAVGAAG